MRRSYWPGRYRCRSSGLLQVIRTDRVRAEIGAVIATRRLRAPDEAQVWAAHMAVVEGETVGDLQFEN